MLQQNNMHSAAPLPEPDTIKQLVRGIIATRPDEIGCKECFERLDRFAEMTLAGAKAAAALPLVQNHLDRCDDCREEFAALMLVLRILV